MLIRVFLGAILILLVGCAAGSTARHVASVDSVQTRDGQTVPIPGLRTSLSIPDCPSDTMPGNLVPRSFFGECRLPGEEVMLDKITNGTVLFQSVQNPVGVKVSQRDFHPKQDACFAGKWIPLSGLDSKWKVGAFALEKPVTALIRFSNGSPKGPTGTTPDFHPEPRGLGIKLVEIPGESILNVENPVSGKMNQDFILINHPQFFMRTPEHYAEFMDLITHGKGFIQILDDGEKKVLIEQTRAVPDVVAETFFSEVPYVLGDTYAKYRVRLCGDPQPVAPMSDAEKQDKDFLRKRIAARIAQGPICLMFSVQRKSPGWKVEDAVDEWKGEGDFGFVDVARIEIPVQADFSSAERDSFCENASFNPWNSLVQNRPAGAISRARLGVYSAVSRKRRTENGVTIREPQVSDNFFDILNAR